MSCFTPSTLEGHLKATKAYAWSSPIVGGDNRRFYAILYLGGTKLPLDGDAGSGTTEIKVTDAWN